MDIKTSRIENAKAAIEKAGGVSQVARLMGYANASFLVQMFGPNPSREPSEKTMRNMEKALGLEPFSLDKQSGPDLQTDQPTKVDAAQLASMIHMVGRIVREEGVSLTPERFATLVSMAYEDRSEAKVRQVVQLLK